MTPILAKGPRASASPPEPALERELQGLLALDGRLQSGHQCPRLDVLCGIGTNTLLVNQTINGSQWVALGTFPFTLGNANSVLLRNTGTTGHVVADAVAFCAAFTLDPQYAGEPWKDDDSDGICNYVEYLNGNQSQGRRQLLESEAQFAERGGQPQFSCPSLQVVQFALPRLPWTGGLAKTSRFSRDQFTAPDRLGGPSLAG